MRTKTLLLTVALSAAGVATSMAQVYSVNAVGYINLTLQPGFNLIANQLNKAPANTLDSIFAGVPEETQIFTFDNATANYVADIYLGSWLNATTGNASTTLVNPGTSLFFFNQGTTPLGVTLVGEVPQGTLTVPIPPGFSAIASAVPQALPLTAANSFPEVEEMQLYFYDANTQNYLTPIIKLGGVWLDSQTGAAANPVPPVGTGFIAFNPEPTTANWIRSFSVN